MNQEKQMNYETPHVIDVTKLENYVPLSELPLSNGFLFGETMYDAETSRNALEIIMGRPISKVVLVNKEQHLDIDGIHKAIRLDVYIKDSNDKIYNVEMQVENRYNIPKRSRHYQSVIDIKLLPAGEINYNKLNDVVIIFICTFDLFKQGRYLYEFENRCIQDTTLALKDGCRKVYLNTRGTNDSDVDSELVEFLHYIENPDSSAFSSHRVHKIHDRVQTVKHNVEVEARYMNSLTYENELLDRGMEKGLAKGLVVGKTEDILDLLEDLGSIPDDLRQRILSQTDLDVLKKWFKCAARAASIEEFSKQIDL